MAAHDDAGLSSSLTDLVTSLMVIFILLLIVTLNNRNQQGQNVKRELLRELEQKLSNLGGTGRPDRLKVTADPADPLGLVIIVPQHLLNFAFSQAIIPPGGAAFLQRFAPELAGVVCSPKFQSAIASVTIEGHTDPIGGDAYNVGLSQDRATAVAVKSIEDLGTGGMRACFEQMLAASGRGKAGAVGGSTREMARERRVIFRIRVRSAEEQGLMRNLEEP